MPTSPTCQLGLDAALYEHLAKKADLIIHNAWPVDFNRHFSSFEPSIHGVQNFISFSQHRKQSAEQPVIPLLFVSSIGAVSNWGSHAPTARERVPEVELMDWKLGRTGYGQSKLACRATARARGPHQGRARCLRPRRLAQWPRPARDRRPLDGARVVSQPAEKLAAAGWAAGRSGAHRVN
jgi:thioester reductase-like protein